MKLRYFLLLPCFLTILFLAPTVSAEDEDAQSATLAGFPDEDALRHALGLSLGAVEVYKKDHGFTYSGYGELLYQKYSGHTHLTYTPNKEYPTGKDQELTLLRGVLFLGYRYSDRIVFNSELRLDRDLYERGVATFASDYNPMTTSVKASLDLAYMDYLMSPELTLRAGVILLPVGLTNEFHRPDEYVGTRPALGEFYTVPTIWHALGFGVAGHKWLFDYRFYVVSGLNAAGFTEFGLRGGKEITWDTISHPAAVLRVDLNPFPGGFIGISYYTGNSGVFGVENPDDLKIHTTLKDLHGQVEWKGALVRAQYSKGLLHSTPELNLLLEKTGKHGIGKRIVSGYVEGGWDFLWFRHSGKMVMLYLRGEASNPQDALPPPSLALGLVKNHQLDFIDWNMGVEYRPIPQLSIRPEYERIHDEDDNAWHEFHLGVVYFF